jgi:hypothetical protein
MKDFALEAAAGHVPGYSTIQKFGRNQVIDTAAIEDIWDAGGIWVAPTTARLHDIASTSASDDGAPAGVGARTIRVAGLTGWGAAQVTEDIIMDGTTNVPTVNAYVIIHRLEVLTKGATSVNVGTITATAQTDGTVTAQIAAGFGQSQMAIYGVPSTQTAFVFRFYSNILKTAGTVRVDNLLLMNPEPDAELLNFITKHTFVNSNTIGNVQIQADVTLNGTDVGSGFDAYLVDN